MENDSAPSAVCRSRHGVSAISVLVCLTSAVLAIGYCASMAGMGGTPMPGGWTLSMVWTRMCGQSWSDAAGAFLGMWMAMTVAMMTPVLGPALCHYGRCVCEASSARAGALALLVAAVYLLMWGLAGMAVYTAGAWLAGIEMRLPAIARLAPLASALLLAVTGALQFTAWKARQLGHCRADCTAPMPLPAHARGACRYGRDLGWHCLVCCAPLTLAMVTLGMGDLRVMAGIAAAIAAERLAPATRPFARLNGAAMLVAGAALASGAFA